MSSLYPMHPDAVRHEVDWRLRAAPGRRARPARRPFRAGRRPLARPGRAAGA